MGRVMTSELIKKRTAWGSREGTKEEKGKGKEKMSQVGFLLRFPDQTLRIR
jgi:hypothetical protein